MARVGWLNVKHFMHYFFSYCIIILSIVPIEVLLQNIFLDITSQQFGVTLGGVFGYFTRPRTGKSRRQTVAYLMDHNDLEFDFILHLG